MENENACAAPQRSLPRNQSSIEGLSPVRRKIIDRAAAVNISMADMSRAIHRNQAYIHQYLFKGTPRRLAEEDRLILSALLGLAEEDLREFAPVKRHVPGPPADGAWATDLPPQLPLLRESEPIVPEGAKLRAPLFHTQFGAADFAIWIERPHGRIRSRDLAYVAAGQPICVGDEAVILRENTVCAIGQVRSRAGDMLQLEADDTQHDLRENNIRVLRIVGLGFV